MDRTRQVALWLLAGLAGAAGAWRLAASGVPWDLEYCPVKRFLLPCPGCGMTRALAALLRGDLGTALALHPLAPLVALEIVAAWLLWGLWALGRRRAPGARTLLALGLANALLFVAVWLARLARGTLPE